MITSERNITLLLIFFLIPMPGVCFNLFFEDRTEPDTGWKAGVAKIIITPETTMWMAGYGFRDHSSEGTLHDLWAKALSFEDAHGNRAVLVTSDLLGFPGELSDRIRNRVEEQYGLSRSEILLNSSHTHAGPVLQNALTDIYPLDDAQRQRVEEYTRKLEDQIVELIGESLGTLEPVRLYAENGVTRFQVNRRNNDAATLQEQTDLNGPNDYAVPVIKVERLSGDLMAVAFGYACHPTVLSNYEWSGDYPGFAQLKLEEKYPGATALFFQGAGADQNPLPRRTVALAKQYGQTLAAAVQRVLNEEMRELSPSFSASYGEVELRIAAPPEKEMLTRMMKESSGYPQRWAARIHNKLEHGEPLKMTYPFPVQAWKLGEQPLLSLGGELVVDYAIELKRIFGQNTFVLGYSNDVMAYIPSTRILMEGGYEGDTSQMVYGLPGKWSADIQPAILYEMVRQAKHAGITPIKY